MTDNPRTTALLELAEMESLLGFALHDLPVHFTDQWTAGIRDMFSTLGVNINNKEQAKAAHVGAYVMLSTVLAGGGVLPWDTATAAAYLWRYLSDSDVNMDE